MHDDARATGIRSATPASPSRGRVAAGAGNDGGLWFDAARPRHQSALSDTSNQYSNPGSPVSPSNREASVATLTH
jgi:hypothetical protein